MVPSLLRQGARELPGRTWLKFSQMAKGSASEDEVVAESWGESVTKTRGPTSVNRTPRQVLPTAAMHLGACSGY